MHKVELTLDLSRAPEQTTQASPLSNICPILVINIILIIIATIIMIGIRARDDNATPPNLTIEFRALVQKSVFLLVVWCAGQMQSAIQSTTGLGNWRISLNSSTLWPRHLMGQFKSRSTLSS